MRKKGQLVWSKLINIALILLLLLVLIGIIYFMRDSIKDLWKDLTSFLRFR